MLASECTTNPMKTLQKNYSYEKGKQWLGRINQTHQKKINESEKKANKQCVEYKETFSRTTK